MAIWVVGFGKTKVLVTVELSWQRRKFQKIHLEMERVHKALARRPRLETLSQKAQGPLSYKLD